MRGFGGGRGLKVFRVFKVFKVLKVLKVFKVFRVVILKCKDTNFFAEGNYFFPEGAWCRFFFVLLQPVLVARDGRQEGIRCNS